MKPRNATFVSALLALGVCVLLAPSALGQIQSTISCPAGHNYWDTLSVMMMDPSLAQGYHMEGYDSNGFPSSYVYTDWWQTANKVWYVKNPNGNPWDINLYDYQSNIPEQGFVYQWVTELGKYQGTNYWNDPKSCKKFNNGGSGSTPDYSFRWAARCAVPGGANSSYWNPPPPAQPYNSNYYAYLDQVVQPAANLGYSLLELKPTGTLTITDTRATPAVSFSITTMPLQYTYSCTQQDVNYCLSREIFDYGIDTNVNPVDGIKHGYGWVRWRLYNNTATLGTPANWVLQTNPPTAFSDHLVAGQVPINFQCF